MVSRFRLWAVFVLALCAPGMLLAQGVNGTLIGTVTQDGAPVPGVSVTVASSALQGTRSAVTNESGAYYLGGLPAGEYTVKFELSGMQTVTQRAKVGVAQTSRADASLRVSAVAEAITVTATAPAVAETTEIQTNFTAKTIEDLPIGRTIAATTSLAPGVTATGPSNNLMISGAASYDNVYTVDGVNIQENLRGQTHTLFIEDAIQETTIQTAGISAEYGNFTGGVINAITKSGGNEFSGSLRDSITNPAWTATSPDIYILSNGVPTRQENPDPLDANNYTYEATLGGRIIRDRLWFFAAYRYNNQTFQNAFTNQTRFFTRGDKDERMEGKLTAAITPKHNIVGSYMEAPRTRTNDCQFGCINESSLDATNELPLSYLNAFYNGVITSNFLIEAKYADKNFNFEGTGGEEQDLIKGTLVRFNAPGWGGTHGNEAIFGGSGRHSDIRDSSQIALKGTYFLGTQSLGNHNLIAGIDRWHETRKSNNYQSPTDWLMIVAAAPPKVDANGNVLMTLTPNRDSFVWFPIELQSLGSDLNTDALYVNDKWDLNNKWQFNLGFRYDANDSADSSGNQVADDSKISPRLGVMYDVMGDGRWRLNGTWGTYVGRLAEGPSAAGSAAGAVAQYQWLYQGPALADVTMEQALTAFFGWLEANGGTNRKPDFASVPGFNARLEGHLVSPNVSEWTIGGSTTIGSNAFIRLDYIDREWQDFYGLSANRDIGTVTSSTGAVADLRLTGNSNDFEKTYHAIQTQAGWRPFTRLNLGANYTWSKLEGNIAGENVGNGPITENTKRFYPEYFDFSWNNPSGMLGADQTHKIRAWAAYDIPTIIGNFNVSLLQRFDSGTPYSLSGTIDIRSNANFYGTGKPGGVTNPGYAAPPTSVTYFFSDRGEFRTPDITGTDFALNYATNPGWLRGVQVFAQGELINAFNEEGLVNFNTSILTHANNAASCTANPSGAGCLQRFNPMAGDQPVEGVHWNKGPLFGKPTTATTSAAQGHYQLPRTYRVSFGLRF